MEDRCDLLCLNVELAEQLRRSRIEPGQAEGRAARARALSDPTRLTLLASLATAEELCVCDMAWVVERPMNLVSHHLRSLRSAGLVSSRRDGKMILYAPTEEGLRLLAAVLPPAETLA
jgi:ArsR family transcriptional regulator, lead/cadmium/zinc/bismuth-responsive transcriptional repressor